MFIPGDFMPRLLHRVSYAVLALMTAPAGLTAIQAADMDTDLSHIETVVVTAQKRAQSPVTVPFALTAYSGDFLDEARLQEFDKLSQFVPGFQVQNQSPNDPGFVMRGITSDSNDSTQEPRVSVFEDGISASQSRGSYFELFDVERIEIAKGPQSTLFGRSALIGGVNVITNKATAERYEGALSAEGGSYGYRMVDGMVNIPLSDTLAFRISGRYKARDGYTKNLLGGADFNSVDTGALRATLSWKPTADFSASLIFNYERDTPNGTGFKSGEIVPSDPVSGTVLGTLDHNSGASLTSATGFEGGKNLGLTRNLYSGTLDMTYRLSPAYTLTSLSGYRRYTAEEIFDPDGSALPLAVMAEDARGDQFSHEFRLNFDNGSAVSWFAGTSYFYENNSSRIPMQFNEPMMLALFTGQINRTTPPAAAFFSSPLYVGYAAPAMVQGLVYAGNGTLLSQGTAVGLAANLDPAHWEQYETYGKTKAVDVYADVTWHATDKLEFEAGLRVSRDAKQSAYSATLSSGSTLGAIMAVMPMPASVSTATLNMMAIPGVTKLLGVGIATQPTQNNGDRISERYHDTGVTWRATARYAVADNSSLYATYGRGRRPDVLAAASPAAPYASPQFTRLSAETVDSYEVGYKTLALNGRLRADVAVYYYAYDNFQTNVMKDAQQVATNAGKANAYGVESAFDWAVAPWADIYTTYAYGHARFGGDSIYHGNQFRLTPDHKLSVGASLRQKLLDGVFTLTPSYTWQSKIYFDDDNDIASEQTSHLLPDLKRDEFQGDYGLANLNLSYQPDGQRWSLKFFVTNLFNRKYIKDAGNTGDAFGIPTFIAGEPRFVGGGLSVRLP